MIFKQGEILEIHRLAISCEFATARELLLVEIGAVYRSRMKVSNVPGDQLLFDLEYMNVHPREDKKIPLALWLRNAAYRVGTKWPDRAERFKQWEQQVRADVQIGKLEFPKLLGSSRSPQAQPTGGLDPASKTSLISAMSECLSLDDLQSAAHRCFGDLPIRSGGPDQPPSVRAVALQCFDLAEREKMPAVFGLAVLQLDRCDAPLRDKLIELYPELLNAGLPFSEIVDATSTLLTQQAFAIATLLKSKQLLTEISLLVSELRCYKALHEALHQVKNNPHPSIPRPRSAAADRRYRQDVYQVLALLESAKDKSNEALMALPEGNVLRNSERPWPILIGGYAKRISVALAPPEDLVRVDVEVARAAGMVNRLEDFNNRIVETAMQLLHGPLAELRELLLVDGQGEAVLSDALAAVNALRLALHVRVLEHARWQEADSILLLLDGTLKVNSPSGFVQFTERWNVVRRQVPILTDSEGRIDLDKLRTLAQQVDGALTRLEESLDDSERDVREDLLLHMSNPYDAFRYEAQQQFLRIDAGLKRNCTDLARIA